MNRSRVSNGDYSGSASFQIAEPDDEADKRVMRKRFRMETAPLSDSSPLSRVSPASHDRRQLGGARVAEIYRQCLALHMQNRISAENAFELGLIDVLPALGDWDPIRLDFTYVGKVISVAAKIYGCRVDNVCQQTHRLYNEVLRSEGKRAAPDRGDSGESENEGSAGPEEAVEKKPKQKAKKPRLESLDLDCMVEKDLSKITSDDDGGRVPCNPVYCKAKEILAKYPMATALTDTFLITSDFGEMDMKSRWSGPTAPIPKTAPCELPPLGDISKCLRKYEGEVSVLSPRFTYPDSTAVPSLDDFVRRLFDEANNNMLDATLNETGIGDLQLDVTIRDEKQPMFESNNAPCVSLEQADDNGDDLCLDFQSVFASLSRKPLEYSYIQAETLPIVGGAKNWKDVLQRLKRITAFPQVARTKRKVEFVPLDLNFESYDTFMDDAERGPKETTLKRIQLDKFTSMEHSLDPEIDFDAKQLSCFFTVPNKGMVRYKPDQPLRRFIIAGKNKFMLNRLRDEAEPQAPVDGATPFVTDVRTALEEDGITLGDMPMNESVDGEQSEEAIDEAASTQPELATLSKAKRIDIPRMKKIIRLLLTKRNGLENGEEENEEQEERETCFQPRNFTKIYRVLAAQPKLKKDITVHSAFVCVLHMCNENSFRLIPKDEVDFTVSNA
ncbi:Condensin complex subunit 2 [Trichuris trichiura]|uniref:Condensin complex subunit 2 n=1 Tax=Trichuris trichiura TaxID=36087 RepID=A0A077Z469_TRITR|nr:Condensin complex subunit 2 [Trichuris trichiura]